MMKKREKEEDDELNHLAAWGATENQQSACRDEAGKDV